VRLARALALVALPLVGSPAVARTGPQDFAAGRPAPHAPPAAAAPRAAPAGRDAAAASGPDLSEAFRRAGQVPALTSLLVARGDSLLGERYFHGGGRGRVVNVRSVSKSVISALVGIAIADGDLQGTDQPISDFLADYTAGLAEPRKAGITIGDLLSMRAGMATTSFRQYGAWVTSSDWIRWALRRPMVCEPGTCWTYSTGNYHLLSVILTRATGTDTRTYARRKLLGPLGIPARPWDRGPKGYYLGGNNMGFTAREMARFGQLYLRDGRRGGRRIVPASWVRRSLRPLAVSSWNGHDYGYGWWGRRLAGEEVWYAWGYGGQYVFVVPRLDLVVVATTDPGREDRRFEADRAIFDLLEGSILPEVRRAAAEGPQASLR